MPSATIAEIKGASIINALITSRKSGRVRSSTQMEANAQALAARLLHILPIAPPPYIATISQRTLRPRHSCQLSKPSLLTTK
jgi:hypothetical protein